MGKISADHSTANPADPLAHALERVRVVSIALNLPGPVAVARLAALGATVVKVEPPDGDPLEAYSPAYYAELHVHATVRRIDLKSAAGLAALHDELGRADLFIASQRPRALARLGLDGATLAARHARLCMIAIVGHAAPRQNEPGHDLTYLAHHGLLRPPHLPTTLMADLLGAERAVTAALALLRARDVGDAGQGAYAEVALEDGGQVLSGPLRHGMTTPDGVLGGSSPGYRLYRTSDGWIALAALEPHFFARALEGLGLAAADGEALAAQFSRQSTRHWLAWAARCDVPLAAVE